MDSDDSETGVDEDISGADIYGTREKTKLASFDDWSNINFKVGLIGNGADYKNIELPLKRPGGLEISAV